MARLYITLEVSMVIYSWVLIAGTSYVVVLCPFYTRCSSVHSVRRRPPVSSVVPFHRYHAQRTKYHA
jgi:hypothetical protein